MDDANLTKLWIDLSELDATLSREDYQNLTSVEIGLCCVGKITDIVAAALMSWLPKLDARGILRCVSP